MENSRPDKFKLGLNLPTDPRWVNLAEMDLAEILTDHAYCEQKAASSCISLIIRFPDRHELIETLAPVVTEEWGHFRRVLAEMKKRNIPFGASRKDEYVLQLATFVTKGGHRDKQLVEYLLMNALIEARSCERFRLLSLHISDVSLREFYRELMISEAGHYRTFIELAQCYRPEEEVMQRWGEWLVFEAEVMRRLPARGDRMH